MSIEKVLVEQFEFLENNGQIGISFQNSAEPVDVAELIYDGRNCAILIRNNTKAFLFTNIIQELRGKLMAADEIMMIEQAGEEVTNAYTISIRKVPAIPYQDTLTDTLAELVQGLQEVYGIDGLERIVQGMKEDAQ